jgi:hypothetical protein
MRWILVVAMLGLVACDDGGDDSGGGGGGSFNTGVDGSKQVGQLTDEEANQVCRASDAYGSDLLTKEQSCVFGALLFAQDTAGCEEFAQMCREAPEEPDEPDACDEGLPPEVEGCTATVDEFEACTEASANQLRNTVAGLSCADAGNAEALQAAFNATPPAACTNIQMKCPNAFNDSGE